MKQLTHGGDWAGYRAEFGRDPLDFSANVSPLGLPEGVAKAITAALATADRYPDPLCRALREKLAVAEGVPAEWLLCGNGAADLIFRLVLAEKPRTALVTAPTFAEYAAALEGGDFDLYLGEVRLTADWDAGALLDAGGALNYGGFASEQLSGLNDAFLLGGNASAERYVKGFAEETPFAPLLFKSKTVLTPSGLVDGMTPTASDPFYGFADWSFHLSGSES